MVEGGIADRTVSMQNYFRQRAVVMLGYYYELSGSETITAGKESIVDHDLSRNTTLTEPFAIQTQCFENLSAVLEEAGSSLQNVVKVGVFLTTMDNFAAMNAVYEKFFEDPKPVWGSIPLTLNAIVYEEIHQEKPMRSLGDYSWLV